MILAIDQGTTETCCAVFGEQAEPIAVARGELGQSFPRPGWVEHDLGEIWELVQRLAAQALGQAGVVAGEIAAIGVTNQRETVCVWDRVSGEPLHAAIVWQDRRTAGRCEELRAGGHEDLIRERTGLVLDPYFSATKIQWLLENVEGLRERAERGEALFGTVDSWLVYKLTGEHATDVTNAARTMLYDIQRGGWDPELLELFDIPGRALPEVRPSTGPFGRAQEIGSVPVAGILGDQQAALLASGCTERGTAKNTYGTGSFLLINSGPALPERVRGVVATVAWQAGRETAYAQEASIFVTGAALQWLRDGLQILGEAGESERIARSLDGNDGVYFVPALTGLGSPHWDPEVRGLITGLTRGTRREHIVRAALEAMAYQTLEAVEAMEGTMGEPMVELRADGGASSNEWLMQFQADILGVPVLVGEVQQATARGAALMAGVGAGVWTLEDAGSLWTPRDTYLPGPVGQHREAILGWREAVQMALGEPWP